MSSAWGRRGVPASAAPGTLRRAPDLISRQRFAHRAQLGDETLLFRSIQCTQCMGLDMVAQRAQLRAQPVRAVGEIQPIGPAVGRLAAPLDPPRLLHSINQPPERDRRDIEMLGERYLAGTFATKQSCNQRPLSPGKTEPACALVDALRHEPGEILDQAAQRAVAFSVSHVAEDSRQPDSKQAYDIGKPAYQSTPGAGRYAIFRERPSLRLSSTLGTGRCGRSLTRAIVSRRCDPAVR